jgi:pyruvate/2-oxoglutarate dehydrogenase complex dihydrolipoamide dehydrogenase (E3) component
MPTTSEHYDAVIIGAGQGGGPLCRALGESGKTSLMVEREHVGGTCVNEGCSPTKTMIASGRVAYLAKRGRDYGVETGKIRISMRKVRERKRHIVDLFRSSGVKRLKQAKNVELLYGEASFTGPSELSVHTRGGKTLAITADQIFINAGCRPAVPHIDGLETTPHLDSTSIMELAEVPEHLLVLGSGYIGLEFGQLFRRLGSRVTMIHPGSHLLHGEDKDITDAIAEILEQDGIELLHNTQTERVQRAGKQIVLHVKTGRKQRKLRGSHLFVATGRVPNTEALHLSAAGIATDEHAFIRVNDKLETNIPGVFALGDIKGGPAFTHVSYDDFRILRTNLIEGGNASIANRLVPYTVFLDPQFGRVGISEEDARRQDLKIRVAKMPMGYVARALEVDEPRGFMKIIVDANSSQILGAAVLGLEGGEVMTQIQMAMMGRLPYQTLQNGVFAHPLLAESLNNVFNHFQD